jgi:hypothetical protein
VRAVAAGVNDALGDAFMIEVRDLLTQHEVFEQGRAAFARFFGVLVVRDHEAVVRRQRLLDARRCLVPLATLPARASRL